MVDSGGSSPAKVPVSTEAIPAFSGANGLPAEGSSRFGRLQLAKWNKTHNKSI